MTRPDSASRRDDCVQVCDEPCSERGCPDFADECVHDECANHASNRKEGCDEDPRSCSGPHDPGDEIDATVTMLANDGHLR